MDRLNDVDYMTDMLHRLGEAGLLIDPRFQGIQEKLFDSNVLEWFERETVKMLDSYWHTQDADDLKSDLLFGVVPITEQLVLNCIHNFFLGTAVFVSHDLKGRVDVDSEIAEMALNDVKSFAQNNGFMNLFLCFCVITGFESHQALAHYGRLTEKAFVSGEKHRPGSSDTLETELFVGLSAGFYEKVEVDGETYIQLTDAGWKRRQKALRMLTESKYLQYRMQVIYISQFDQIDDWEAILDKIFPEAVPLRSDYLHFLEVRPGMEVLELGCGSGTFTFDSGLADAVGKEGWVTATDPSAGMLYRAQQKLDKLGYENVSIEAAAAEEIPYGNQEFDCTVGVSFFHFSDKPRALKEMIRVTRPGGIVGLQGPLQFNLDRPFFREWFEEIFLLARKRGADRPQSYLPQETGEISGFVRKHGLKNVEEQTVTMPWVFADPENVLQFMVYGVGLFQQEMIFLPLAAREELIERLIEKGKDICARYSLAERTIELPTYFVKGTV
ncbi:MAG TPA: methyltransferase domain-containing protein [Bacillales bacterium]